MHRPTLTVLAGVTGLGLLATTGLVVASQAASGTDGPNASRTATHRHHPAPSRFTHGRVDNPWFPLKPGTRFDYRGSEDGNRTRDVLIATYRTRVIDGVTCRVVFDRVWTNGRLGERTHDFYAQTRRGTVWYFGERTATIDRHGHVISREGSFMTAHPRRGPSYFQEYYPGHAEDVFTVDRLGARVTVPLLSSSHALITRETSPLEPGVVDHKYYVRDVGDVSERTVRGGNETLHLVALTHERRP